MNRKFLDDHADHASLAIYETRVVGVLKKLICQSDCFLNLHEGSGIFSPQWENDRRNPKRYGQSIIADDNTLSKSKDGNRIDLAQMAEQVVKKINTNITDPALRFHFNNHRTRYDDSIHKEQRHSATFYALNVCKIPAFGIESAKSLPLETKVRQQIWGINGFMDILGIVPETPGIDLKKPEMQYMIISVNGSIPVVVGRMQHLKIRKGDTVQVHDIVANYERGLSVDILGVGTDFNDMKKKLTINESTRIEAKKDFYACGSVFLDLVEEGVHTPSQLTVTESKRIGTIQYKLRINGRKKIVDNYGRVKLKQGDKLIIEDIITGEVDPSEYVVNFKGFVGNQSKNNGEDRGYLIDTAAGVLMPRYSKNKKGRHYHVLTTLNGKEVGKIYIEIHL